MNRPCARTGSGCPGTMRPQLPPHRWEGAGLTVYLSGVGAWTCYRCDYFHVDVPDPRKLVALIEGNREQLLTLPAPKRRLHWHLGQGWRWLQE